MIKAKLSESLVKEEDKCNWVGDGGFEEAPESSNHTGIFLNCDQVLAVAFICPSWRYRAHEGEGYQWDPFNGGYGHLLHAVVVDLS